MPNTFESKDTKADLDIEYSNPLQMVAELETRDMMIAAFRLNEEMAMLKIDCNYIAGVYEVLFTTDEAPARTLNNDFRLIGANAERRPSTTDFWTLDEFEYMRRVYVKMVEIASRYGATKIVITYH